MFAADHHVAGEQTGARLCRGCENNGVGYVLGLGINAALKVTVRDLTQDAALAWLDLKDKAGKVRSCGEPRYGARSWKCELLRKPRFAHGAQQ